MSYFKSSYVVGDIITDYFGNTYLVTVGGTTPTAPFNPDNVSSGVISWGDIRCVKQEVESGAKIDEWQANTSYSVGDLLVHDQTIYEVNTDFTSGSTFSETNLTKYVAGEMQGATSLAGGARGLVPEPSAGDEDKVLFGNGTWDTIESGGTSIEEWQANTSYVQDQLIMYDDIIYKVDDDFTSGSTFDDTDLIELTHKHSTSQDIQALFI